MSACTRGSERRRVTGAAILGVAALALAIPALAAEVGTALFARGVATAQSGQDVRLIGEGTPIFEGDVINTGAGSFAILSFSDGTRMTLRPDTVFAVERFNDKSGEESALMRLFKGGLRALTGLVSSRNPDAFKLETTVATIGIRGTDFSARLCGEDCAVEAQQTTAAETSEEVKRVVGRVAFVSGELNGQTENGQPRRLLVGAALYEADLLETGADSFAVLAFDDDSRVTLQAETTFLVREHFYSAGGAKKNQAFYQLIKGGLRAVSGLISKENPDGYKVETPVAIIGVRSTKFDLICQGACVGEDTAQGKNSLLSSILNALISPVHAAVPVGDGLYVIAREGTVYAERDDKRVFLLENETYFLRNITALPVVGAELPLNIIQNLGPLPEETEVPPGFFDTEPVAASDPGLFVAVYDEGHATVEQADGPTLHVGKDEAVYASETRVAKVAGGVPDVIRQDAYNFNPGRFTGMSLLGGDVPSADAGERMECAVR